jgi:Ca2+-binding EF-hand superfamily protein
VDTSEFIAGFRMPDDMYTASLVTMMDADDNGHITFHEMVRGVPHPPSTLRSLKLKPC